MQHSLINLQEAFRFLQSIACGWVMEHEWPGLASLAPAGQLALGGSRTASFTLPLPGTRGPIAAGSILQQVLFLVTCGAQRSTRHASISRSSDQLALAGLVDGSLTAAMPVYGRQCASYRS